MRRSLTLCAAALTLLSLVSAWGGVPATASLSAAPAADTPDPVRISLTRVSPSILTEQDNLTILNLQKYLKGHYVKAVVPTA